MEVKCTCAMQKQNVLILLHCFFYFRLVSTSLLRYLFDCTVLHFIEIHNMLLIYIYLLKKRGICYLITLMLESKCKNAGQERKYVGIQLKL